MPSVSKNSDGDGDDNGGNDGGHDGIHAVADLKGAES